MYAPSKVRCAARISTSLYVEVAMVRWLVLTSEGI
jgi:hypothetical protein